MTLRNETTSDNIPLIKGSTALILRTLYASQIPVKNTTQLPKLDKAILLSAQAANAKASMPGVKALLDNRDNIDSVIGKLMEDAEKRTTGKSFFDSNMVLSNKIEKLQHEYETFNRDFNLIKEQEKELQAAIATLHEEGKTVSMSDPAIHAKLSGLAQSIMTYRNGINLYHTTFNTVLEEQSTLAATLQKQAAVRIDVMTPSTVLEHKGMMGGG